MYEPVGLQRVPGLLAGELAPGNPAETLVQHREDLLQRAGLPVARAMEKAGDLAVLVLCLVHHSVQLT